MGLPADEPEEKTFSEPGGDAEGPEGDPGSRSRSDSGPEESGEAVGEGEEGEEKDGEEQKLFSDKEL